MPVHEAAKCKAQQCHAHHGPLVPREAPMPPNGDRILAACPVHREPLDYWMWPNIWHCPTHGCHYWVADEVVTR